MALKRWIDNPKLKKFDKISIPVTDTHADDNTDYQMTGGDLAAAVLANTNNLWNMKATVLPTCRSFSDPEYLTAGTWFFEDISNTEQKPDKLAGKKVQFARLLCEAGRSETEQLNFVKQYLLYVNMTDNVLELSMRGVLMNGGGEVQGATPWKTGTDEAAHSKEADHATNADEATHAASADMAKNAGTAANAHNAANATLAETLKTGATMGGLEVITTKYASKIKGRNLLTVLGVSTARAAFDKLRALNGNYDGLMIGDYIDIPQIVVSGIGTLNNDYNNLRVIIAGFDHYYKVGDTETLRGILFIFENCAFTHRMNPTNDNTGGYKDCELRGIINGAFATGLENAIGPIKTVRRLAEAHKYDSWWTNWVSEKAFLPTEVEIWGHQVWGNEGYSTGTSMQYPIYAIDPNRRMKKYNGARQWYWEGTSSFEGSGSTHFCHVDAYGSASNSVASNVNGVSPAFYL